MVRSANSGLKVAARLSPPLSTRTTSRLGKRAGDGEGGRAAAELVIAERHAGGDDAGNSQGRGCEDPLGRALSERQEAHRRAHLILRPREQVRGRRREHRNGPARASEGEEG